MDADENGRAGARGLCSAAFQRQEDILFASHLHAQAFGDEFVAEKGGDLEREVLFDQSIGDRAAIMAAVACIDEHEGDFLSF